MTFDLGPFESGKGFSNAVKLSLDESFKSDPFLRVGKLNFVMPLNDQFDGWIGLNLSSRGAFLGQLPLVANWGIHCRPISQLLTEWRGEKYRRGVSCTVPISWEHELGSCNFVYLANGNISKISELVAQFYESEVFPVVSEFADYRAVIPFLETQAENGGGFDQSLLLAYRLGGLTTEAERYAKEIGSKCDRDPDYASYTEKFLSQYRTAFDP